MQYLDWIYLYPLSDAPYSYEYYSKNNLSS